MVDKLKAVGYTRISTGEQSRFSLDGQEDEIDIYCERNNMELIKVYTDMKSGLDFENREELQQLLDDAENGVFDVLLVTEWDRLSRDIEITGYIKFTLKSKGIELVAIHERKLNNEYDELVEGVVGLFSKFETKRRLRRVKRGIERAKKNNKFMSRPPLGYKVDLNGDVVIDYEKSKIIKKIFKDYAWGQSMSKLSREFGLPRTTIGYILRNPFYYDKELYGKHEPIIEDLDFHKAKWRLDKELEKKQNHYRYV